MTVGGWIVFCILTLCFFGVGIGIAASNGETAAWIASIAVAFVLTAGLLVGMLWYYGSTASGQRALKSQQSNFDGGIERTVTVYGLGGEEIKSWSGKFDVTEDSQETYFDIDGRRVIIQGGIIINEEHQ